MRLLNLALVVLLTLPALAYPIEADLAAISGDLDKAESGYRAALETSQDPVEVQLLLLRLTAVAQARNDMLGLSRWGRRLEQKLTPEQQPGIAMRLYLIRGAAATRTRDIQGAHEAFSKARPLAQKLVAAGDPGGALGLAECNSYDYLGNLARVGRPQPSAYQAACQAAYQPSNSLPATAERPLWPLDIYRSTYWTRLWVWQAWEYYYLAYRSGELALSNEWAQLSHGIGSFAFQALVAAYRATNNLEYGTAATHIALEMTEGFPLASWTPAMLSSIEAAFKNFPPTAEVQFIRGRYHRSAARRAFVAEKNFDQALKHYQEAARSFGQARYFVDQMDIWIETAYVYSLEEPRPLSWAPTVEQNLNQLLELSARIEYSTGRYFGMGFLGTLKAARGEKEAAEPLLREALTQLMAWSRLSGESPTARAQTLKKPEVRLFSDTLVEILIQKGSQAEALEFVGQYYSQAETAGVDLDRLNINNPTVERGLQSLKEGRQRGLVLRNELRSAQAAGDQQATEKLEAELAGNRAEFQRAVNDLRAQNPKFEGLLSIKPSSFGKLQPLLPQDVLLVAYYPSEKQTLLFAATRENLNIFTSPLTLDQLNEAVRKVRRAITQEKDPDSQLLRRLYAGLIKPLEPVLEEGHTLTVVPSGYLYYLPFSALEDEQGAGLVERNPVAVLTATEMLDRGHYKKTGHGSLLALGNPDGSLPGATQEIERLAAKFPKTRVFMGKEFTQQKVDGASEVLHLATHGVLNSNDLNESYLLVSGDDGRLTTGEIYGLSLQGVSLVTLSACETALGQFSPNPGSDVASLAQAFSFAGSRSLLGSLWKVDDEATAALMEEFYSQLVGGASKAEALRQAQLKVRSDPRWQHPSYWSAFVLFGDWH